MQVFEKLNQVEDEVFQELQKIDKQIAELKTQQKRLKDLGKTMNPERFKTKAKGSKK